MSDDLQRLLQLARDTYAIVRTVDERTRYLAEDAADRERARTPPWIEHERRRTLEAGYLQFQRQIAQLEQQLQDLQKRVAKLEAAR
jgi:hypothetical protein